MKASQRPEKKLPTADAMAGAHPLVHLLGALAQMAASTGDHLVELQQGVVDLAPDLPQPTGEIFGPGGVGVADGTLDLLKGPAGDLRQPAARLLQRAARPHR